MTLIRVNPESVRSYGTQAQTLFEAMTSSLDRLVDDVVAVRYYGPNAVAFKTECGRLATDFGTRLSADMGAMADAVRRSTSNIAASLGGAPISIQLANKPIVAPTPEAVDFVDIDTAALDAVMPVVGTHFTSIRDSLTDHFQRLQQTDWEGNAKLGAVDAVGRFTSSARQSCDASEQALTTYIRNQIQSVVAADR
jgi:hypothetical protein